METKRQETFLNPYLAGVLLGLTLLTSFILLGAGLGASNGLARIAAWCGLQINAEHILGGEYFGNWGNRPLDYYLVYMLAGIFIGGFFSALANGRVKVEAQRAEGYSIAKRLSLALLGGILAGFASRLARGCTSGIGLTGLSLFSTGGLAFIVAMFVGGYAFAWSCRRQWND